MAQRLQFRRGTAALATSNNPILVDGELGYETDTGKFKIGDGTTAWNSLSYDGLIGPEGPQGIQGIQGIQGDSGGPVPTGGTSGQIIVKDSATDFDVSWQNNTVFPVGTIWMFDGTGWVDNSTIPGWYACIAANSGQGCPDLEDTFIKGSAPADVGTTGGSNTHTLGATEIPSHTHSIGHNHGSASTGGHHHHQGNPMMGTTSAYGYETSTTLNSVNYNFTATNRYPETSVTTPSINLPAYAGNSDGGTGGGLAHNNEPAYYKLIFIRKCS